MMENFSNWKQNSIGLWRKTIPKKCKFKKYISRYIIFKLLEKTKTWKHIPPNDTHTKLYWDVSSQQNTMRAGDNEMAYLKW